MTVFKRHNALGNSFYGNLREQWWCRKVNLRRCPGVGQADSQTKPIVPGKGVTENWTFSTKCYVSNAQRTTLKAAVKSYESLIFYSTQTVTGKGNDYSTFGLTKGREREHPMEGSRLAQKRKPLAYEGGSPQQQSRSWLSQKCCPAAWTHNVDPNGLDLNWLSISQACLTFYRYCHTGREVETSVTLPLQRLSRWLAEGRDAVRSPQMGLPWRCRLNTPLGSHTMSTQIQLRSTLTKLLQLEILSPPPFCSSDYESYKYITTKTVLKAQKCMIMKRPRELLTPRLSIHCSGGV